MLRDRKTKNPGIGGKYYHHNFQSGFIVIVEMILLAGLRPHLTFPSLPIKFE